MRDKRLVILYIRILDITFCFSIERFFGLRDFIHFINYIRRKGQSDITAELVLQSLERNFNGTKEFEEICKVFLKEVLTLYVIENHLVLSITPYSRNFDGSNLSPSDFKIVLYII